MGNYLFGVLCHERAMGRFKTFCRGKDKSAGESPALSSEKRGYTSQNLKMGLQNGEGGTSFFWPHP